MASRTKAIGLLALAVLGGIALLTRSPRKPNPRRTRMLDGRSLPKLQRAILGNTRGAVVAIFGPPNASGDGAKEYWHADTWYYPLDLRRRTAVAIRFTNNIADHVDFIVGPRPLV